MRCFLVLLCVTLASTGPDTPQAGFWTWAPALTHLQGALRTWIPVVDLDTSLAEHKDPDFGADILEAEEPASVFCPVSGAGQSAGVPDLDLSHPEDLFAEASQGRSRNGWQRKRQNSRSMGMCLAFFGNNA